MRNNRLKPTPQTANGTLSRSIVSREFGCAELVVSVKWFDRLKDKSSRLVKKHDDASQPCHNGYKLLWQAALRIKLAYPVTENEFSRMTEFREQKRESTSPGTCARSREERRDDNSSNPSYGDAFSPLTEDFVKRSLAALDKTRCCQVP
uniref:Uncharacterized protein n=1 Tax=Vespula pensylvanica TaxID=30213 RepID=A0A834NSB9_VESPE|nr:hypothetical protein H0235_011635 [Vespula pensylvanica]